jgi:hypothetical protein
LDVESSPPPLSQRERGDRVYKDEYRNMGLALWVARALGSTILGILIFLGFLTLLVVNNFSSKLFSADFYTRILNEQDVYNRIYDEVLLDDRLTSDTRGLLGDIQLVTHEEIVRLLREIITPEYLQGQVQENIHRFIDYLNEDSDRLELYVELGPPLAKMKPALFDFIEQKIDEVKIVEPDPNKGPLEQLVEAQGLAQSLFSDLSQGRVPQSIPSVTAIPEPFRADLFDALFTGLLNEQFLDEPVRQSLLLSSQSMEDALVAGDTHGFLKQAARAALGPVIDDGVADFRRELALDSQDRINLISVMARENPKITEGSLRAEVANFRDSVNRIRTLGTTAGLAVVIGGAALMGLIHLPSLSNALRWPGLTLLLTGLVLYVLGQILEATLPDRMMSFIDRQLIDRSVEETSGIPPSAVDLFRDVLYSFGQQFTEGMADPALVLIIIGTVLFGGSFVVFAARSRLPALPWLRA